MKYARWSKLAGHTFCKAFTATALTACSIMPATSAIVGFTDRGAFQQAAGIITTETFNTSNLGDFRTQPVSIGSFALTGFGPNQDIYNTLSSGPATYNVDGTTYITGITDAGGTGFSITFSAPITSFGADFRGFNNLDTVPRSVLSVNGTNLSVPQVAGNSDASFFGLISDTPFTTVSFLRNPDYTRIASGDVFGLDNVSFAGVPAAPEASTWAMMILGFASIGLVTYRKRKAAGLAAVKATLWRW